MIGHLFFRSCCRNLQEHGLSMLPVVNLCAVGPISLLQSHAVLTIPAALNCTLDRICESNTAQLRLGNGMGFVPKYDLHRYSVKYPEDPRGVPETLRHPHHSSHVIRIDCLFPLVANDENQIGPSTSVVLLESSLIHEQQGK